MSIQTEEQVNNQQTKQATLCQWVWYITLLHSMSSYRANYWVLKRLCCFVSVNITLKQKTQKQAVIFTCWNMININFKDLAKRHMILIKCSISKDSQSCLLTVNGSPSQHLGRPSFKNKNNHTKSPEKQAVLLPLVSYSCITGLCCWGHGCALWQVMPFNLILSSIQHTEQTLVEGLQRPNPE